MFIYKNKIIEVKKVSFSIIDRFLFLVTILQPDIDGNKIAFKQKNKRLFKYAIRHLISLLCDPVIKPVFLSHYMYILSNIVSYTKLFDILSKVNKAKEKNIEQPIITEKGEQIFKSDYLTLYLDTYYKLFIRYFPCFENDFKDRVGFLEYEELINELEKNRQEDNLQNIFNIGCGFSGSKDVIGSIQKNIDTLKNYGFDEKRFRDDVVLGVGGGENG